MLSRFFKKREGADAPQTHPAAPTQADAKAAKARQADAARTEWLPRVQAAQGDDAALLLITQTAPLWEVKLAAVEALSAEESLKQAERELRSQDSRVHRVAKKRLVAAVAQREARSGAQAVIDDATALLQETPLPANRLVAVDRGWQALAAELLTPEQLTQFAALREQLNTVLREEGEAQQRRQQEQQQRLIEQARQAEADEEARLAALAAEPPAEPAPAPEAVAEVAPPPPPPPKTLLNAEQRAQLDSVLSQAEAALAEGQLSDMQQRLQDVDNTFDALKGITLSDKLRARHQALHAEQARLKGWQQWGGALALDSLVDEAEALARITLAAAADPETVNPPKLRIKPHADSIQALRARWKEIDRLGAPSNQTLWHRFDAALHAAYQPVAAQQAALKAQRRENLQAREALLATLDAVPLGDAPQNPDDPAAHWKEPLRALNQFQLAWRQLGPLEHTVPSAAKNALLQHLNASVERIEAPLNEARRVAQAERERLVAHAEALVQELARNPATRDAPQRVRELQAEWQQHARSLPLARAVEGALWARFRSATDAVFAQREAAFSARDTELAANLAEREALIARLTAIDLDTTPVAEMQRALGDADRAWRHAVEVPRAAVKSLDTRFSQARAALAQAVAESAQKRWQAQCDTLLSKLVLCEEREAAEAADLASRWAPLEALPAAWEKPLAQRWSQAPAPGPLAAPACDDLLLQLEAALDLPASAESLAARRDLKLRALKDALEGRAAQTQDPLAQRAQWFAAALRQGGMSSVQRERLRALINALRQAAPGSLGGVAR